MKLQRLKSEPILIPNKENDWESKAVFNCGVVRENGSIHMLYRAENNPDNGLSVSSMGYAVSKDGISFKRTANPIFIGKGKQENRGVEDPRITRIGNEYFMLYTAYSGKNKDNDWYDTKIAMASTKDFKKWKRWGVVLDEVDNKDAALFPEKIGGRYALFHRRKPHIWISYSDDLYHWDNHTPIMKPIENTWESLKIGIAGPPHKHKKGWILFYHGVDNDSVYRLGIALLDLNNPAKVLIRHKDPILEPKLDWELSGQVPNVVFSCGSVKKGDKYLVYYGGADTAIGVAEVSEKEVDDWIERGS